MRCSDSLCRHLSLHCVLTPLSQQSLMAQFHLTSLVVMDAFGRALVVGWLVHEEKTAEALACGFAAWRSAVVGVMPDFKPANFFSDDDPAEHKALRCGPLCHRNGIGACRVVCFSNTQHIDSVMPLQISVWSGRACLSLHLAPIEGHQAKAHADGARTNLRPSLPVAELSACGILLLES